MAEARSSRIASETATIDESLSKEHLQRQMEDARETIAQTVTDIKDTVVDKYNSVKETITDTFDWREQFRNHPVAWCIGALSVGYVIGNSLVAAFTESKHKDQLLSQLAAIGDRFTDELSRRGMSILAPALTGTVLVPVLASKLQELTGIDLSNLPDLLLNQDGDERKTAGKSKRKKKSAAKKQNKKKRQRTEG